MGSPGWYSSRTTSVGSVAVEWADNPGRRPIKLEFLEEALVA